VTTFQLDESFDMRKFAKRCSTEGRCKMERFPPNLRGKKDFEWLPILLANDAPILTTDFGIAIHADNRQAIPSRNSGIIVVKPKIPESGFGSKRAIPLIDKFKLAFPEWSNLNWSDTYVEITDVDVYVRSFVDPHQKSGETVSYDNEDFTVRLIKAVAKAQRIQRVAAGGAH
jgi:hypothetical protein